MRILFIVLALIIVLALASAAYFRLAPMSEADWHVDPASAVAPASPNYALRQGASAPVIAASPDQVAAALSAQADSEGARVLAGDFGTDFVTYISRSRLMGFPDAISIRLTPEGDATRVEMFSRSRFGYSDMGVNEARVARWIDAATP